MEANIISDKDDNDVPYLELKFSPEHPDDTPLYITFRKYYKRVFVGVEDYSYDQTQGFDLEDVWLSPIIIIEKTLIPEFDPRKAFLKALVYADAEYLADSYEYLEPMVKRWLNG